MNQTNSASKPKLMKLRYAGNCRDCGAGLLPGERAFYVRAEKAVVCLPCGGEAVADPVRREATNPVPEPISSEPGASARRQYEKKRQAREEYATAAFGRLGKLAAKLLPEPRDHKNWKIGAQGEREAAARLATLLEHSKVLILHDRRMPGSAANIDHIAIGPGGVTVIDTKKWNGKARVRRTGIGKRAREQFVVNGNDRTKTIQGVIKQMAAVESAIKGIRPPMEIELRGAVYWWNYNGLPAFGEVRVNGIPVYTGKKIQFLYEQLAQALPAA
jgi:hypothetical protein